MLIGLLILLAGIGFVVSLFVRDRRFRTHGRRVRVRLEEVRHVGTSETGSVTVRYRASWREDGVLKIVDGRETIPAKRLRQMREGATVDILYLGDGKAQLDLG
ncbi:hypothetical protein ACI7YT_17915 [Microbacterium sp. M]|uniref:hypothetical protein n=1 Tax=Microbacterium sp. M TaxID=3377125 RepID=UPI00386FF540